MKMQDFRLDGKVALVTGASYGIGFAIASGMAEAGATIVFNDIKQELVDKGLAAYKEEGIKAHGYVCDVTDEDAVNAFIAKVEKEVGVNIQRKISLLNNKAQKQRHNQKGYDKVNCCNISKQMHANWCPFFCLQTTQNKNNINQRTYPRNNV